MSEAERLIARLEAFITRLEVVLGASYGESTPREITPGEIAHGEIDWAAGMRAFRWERKDSREGTLKALPYVSALRLDDLRCLDRQKQMVVRNTRQFLGGFPANHALLWGPRGTGKSSLVKALIHEFASHGLCFVEVEREALVDLHSIFEILYGRTERFILFCDDLSFEPHDPSHRALKTALDGSLGCVPDNVLVYATSNRRHLVPERSADNLMAKSEDGELHHSEAVEERISLSERFGLWLAFHPLCQEEYLEIVSYWIARLGMSEDDPSSMRREALRWALARGSRSGRTAYQFARDRVGQARLGQPS